MIRKGARVYTNDPRKNVQVLSIKAFVKVPIYLPDMSTLGDLLDKESPEPLESA